MIKIRDISCL